MQNNSSTETHIDKRDKEIQKAIEKLEQLGTQWRLLKAAQELKSLERETIQAIDKLAGLLRAKQTQGSRESEWSWSTTPNQYWLRPTEKDLPTTY